MSKERTILKMRRSKADKAPARACRATDHAPARRQLLQAAALTALWPASVLPKEDLAAGAADAAVGVRPGTEAGRGGATQEQGDRRILILGDSLSAEYGIGRGEGWVTLLEQRTLPKGWRTANASISGETTAGGLSRLPALLVKHVPDITVIELGANDALRGLPLASTEGNLRRMIQLAKGAGSRPLLVGMMMPPNFGPAYARQFSDMFRKVAESEKIALVPFLLEGFADDLAWFQPDRIHPTAKAQPRMLDNVWPVLGKML